jgi:uncharacterized protein YwqG
MNENPEITEALNRACKPAIWLRRAAGARGKSRLGGLPSLPIGVEWPRLTETNVPLHFLGQLDLSDLPPMPLLFDRPDLPKSGVLMFFASMEEEMLWDEDPWSKTRVLYSETIAADRATPDDIPSFFYDCYGDRENWKGLSVFPEAPLEAFIIDSFGQQLYLDAEMRVAAEWRMLASVERATGSAVPIVSLGDRPRAIEMPAAVEVSRSKKVPKPTTWQMFLKRLGFSSHSTKLPHEIVLKKEPSIRQHLVLGAATNIQGTAPEAHSKGLVLLFQIDTDWGVHEDFQFCDMGMAQFWISAEDLNERRFDKAWATTEGA